MSDKLQEIRERLEKDRDEWKEVAGEWKWNATEQRKISDNWKARAESAESRLLLAAKEMCKFCETLNDPTLDERGWHHIVPYDPSALISDVREVCAAAPIHKMMRGDK